MCSGELVHKLPRAMLALHCTWALLAWLWLSTAFAQGSTVAFIALLSAESASHEGDGFGEGESEGEGEGEGEGEVYGEVKGEEGGVEGEAE